MEKLLLSMPLFAGFNEEELSSTLKCLNAQTKEYARGEAVLMTGGRIASFGVVLAGQVRILRESAAGRRALISVCGAGETFAEVFVCAGVSESPVTVEASSDVRVLFLDYARILGVCSSSCASHTRLIANMLRVLAQKNLMMNRKISFLGRRRLRARIAAYLLERMSEERGAHFSCGMNRAELADFLHADRSALSRELSRMKRDGLIDYSRTHFTVIGVSALEDADMRDTHDE